MSVFGNITINVRDEAGPVLWDAALELLRLRLPLDDPDRRALDVVADARFAALACACPELCACDEEARP